MGKQKAHVTDRQMDLLTRAQKEHQGRVEPLLDIRAGIKLRTINKLARQGLVKKVEGQWHITETAKAVIKGKEFTPPVIETKQPDPPKIPSSQEKLSESKTQTKTRKNSKQSQVIALLRRPEGATIEQISSLTGWQTHTVRGFFSGALKKKLGLNLTSHKGEGELAKQRIYRVEKDA